MTRFPKSRPDELSFIHLKPEGGYAYWSVTPTGTNAADFEIGEKLGNEFLSFIGRFPTYGNSTLLDMIVNDMIAARKDHCTKWGQHLSGIERGFLRQVTGYAMATARLVEASKESTAA